MRYLLLAIPLLVVSLPSAEAQPGLALQMGVQVPGVSIGIHVPAYPNLQPVPGYPVYYAPGLNLNYFYYDGLYWVYQGDNWYSSTWYDGPWRLLGIDDVPLFLWRIPVGYYRSPPAYFRGWNANAAPHWGQHWGAPWQQRHSDWNHWDHRAMPHAAPLPMYQRQFHGGQYPHSAEQQHSIRSQNYSYQPRESISQQHFQAPGAQRGMSQHGGDRGFERGEPGRGGEGREGGGGHERR